MVTDLVAPGAFAPRAHHERVIHGGAGDFVDAFLLQLISLFDEAGQMLGGAGRSESAGNREERDAAAAEIFVGSDRLRPFGSGLHERRRRNGVAHLDAHTYSLSNGRATRRAL
jgi:hypothetical protein